MDLDILKPKALRPGHTIGVFTPSSPGYQQCEGLLTNGVANLETCGFNVKLGKVTDKRLSQGYRSAPPKERADEFMSLILDPDVDGLMSTIGGYNSSSMIPFLDFAAIRASRKSICGYSDVTSLHVAILKFSGLRTFYGPGVMCWFGDWPDGVSESTKWFLDAVMHHWSGEREVFAPELWSDHKRSWDNGDWRTKPRAWQKNAGWKILRSGTSEAPILALNLNTVLSAAGTKYWPDVSNKILLIEDMDAPLNRSERSFRQLHLMGVFDQICGLIVSKPEFYDQQNAPFGYEDLIVEIVGDRDYPIVANFDCGHTLPMITIPQLSPVRLKAEREHVVQFTFLDGAIAE